VVAKGSHTHNRNIKRWKQNSKARIAEYAKEWVQKNPEKYQARLRVQTAVKQGVLVRKPCQKCGRENSVGHHPDYTKPLEVIWLCRIHHRAIHYGSK